MIHVFLAKINQTLIVVNIDNDKEASSFKKNNECRELTETEQSLFVDGLHLAGSENTSVTGTALDDAVISYQPMTTDEKAQNLCKLISQHAEDLISKGFLVNGRAFRCDDISVGRLSEMKDRAQDIETEDGSWSQKFMTSAGDVISLSSAAQVKALHTRAVDYAGDVLSASATLQESLIDDFKTSTEWPAVPDLTL